MEWTIDTWPIRVEDRGHDSPCHTWGAGKTTAGYSETWDGQRVVYGHRVAYERANGAIPPGLVLDHLCHNRDCVNPEHLEAVTVAVNNRRGQNTRLTEPDVRSIMALKGRMTSKQIAAKYGISHWYVKDLWRGKYWREVTANG